MKLMSLIPFIVRLWPVLQAFLVLGKAVMKAVDPASPGGRWIDPAERPDINRAFWDEYDKLTGRRA